MNEYRLKVISFLAESDNKDAMWAIVRDIMSDGRHKVADDKSLVVLEYLNRLIEKGDNEAVFMLGTLYYTWLGSIPNDYRKAMELYEQAAKNSEYRDSWAINNLAYCYYYGRAGKVDYEKAYYYFALAALYNNPNAVYKLGDFYYNGNFVEKDLLASFYWYNLAKNYYRSYQGYETDDEDSEDFKNLADSETKESYYEYMRASIAMRLGRAYLFGEGTNADKDKALNELSLAEKLFGRQADIGDKFSREGHLRVKNLIDTATKSPVLAGVGNESK